MYPCNALVRTETGNVQYLMIQRVQRQLCESGHTDYVRYDL